MKKCEEENIPFHLKYAIRPHRRDDGIVIGSDSPFFKKHIEILRKIAIENPELLESCGTPHFLTANLDGWMGIADECDKFMTSYTQNMLNIFDISFKKFLIKNPEISQELEAYEELSYYKETTERNLIKRQEIRKEILSPEKYQEELERLISWSLLLKNIQSKNLKVIYPLDDKKLEELYNIFLNECKYEELDLNNPAFKKETKSQLIDMDEDEKGLTEEYIIKIAKDMEVAREKENARLAMQKLIPKTIVYDAKRFDK